VGEIRKKKHNKARNVHKAVFETVVSSDKYQDHEDEMNETMEQHDHQNNDDSINDDSDVHCDDKLNDDKDDYTTSDDMNSTASPEDEDSSVDLNSLTPITSEDESEPLIERKRRSWYSPFSTGLDLDILQKRPDPFATHYKFDSFMLPPPISSSFKSNIELLQNHPFIPTSKQQQVQHTLGPIGDSIRPSFVHF
jgi:hypothetical protein